jgi:uncharacterized membrane protein YecN with MAPEG domain
MISTGDFRREQRGVALAMAGALVSAVVVLGFAAIADRAGAPTPFLARLQFAIRVDLFVIVWLATAIANVARLRFFSEQDIAGSSAEAGSTEVREAGAILQNTLEQVGLAIVTHLIVAASFSRSVRTLGALVCLFAIGRLLFWLGYKHGARARAFGFALTFYPSILALAASATAILCGWAG